jgi:hypothetical protein
MNSHATLIHQETHTESKFQMSTTPNPGTADRCLEKSGGFFYFYSFKITISTRRFCLRPSSVEFVATGFVAPKPCILTRGVGTFLLSRYCGYRIRSRFRGNEANADQTPMNFNCASIALSVFITVISRKPRYPLI